MGGSPEHPPDIVNQPYVGLAQFGRQIALSEGNSASLSFAKVDDGYRSGFSEVDRCSPIGQVLALD